MKRKILPLLLVLISSGCLAQDITSINWSERQHYENGIDGFFDYFVGGNNKNIYAKFANLAWRSKANKFKLVSFDKNTMKKNGECQIMDLTDAKAGEYKELEYYKAVVFENCIYVFWIKETKQKDELYVQSFDANLKKIKSIKKIYELKALEGKKAKKPELFVLGQQSIGDKIVIGGEIATEVKDVLKIEYKLMNSDLSFLNTNQVELPVRIKSRNESLTASYELGEDGNLHIKSYVLLDKEDAKKTKQGESTVYPIYSVVELNSGTIKSFPVKFDNKNIYQFDYVADKNNIKLVGFYCDILKDKGGNDLHGIFYATIENKAFTLEDVNFSAFTPAQLNNLFSKDKEDRKDRKRLFQSKSKKKSEEESLASNYVIESIQSDKKDIVLFCSRMRNYTTRSCDAKGNCTTRYYCEKSNITGFKLSNEGKILWASNLDRSKTYSGWDIYDVDAVKDNGFYYVLYGSDYYTTAQKKNLRGSKAKKYKEDNLEYAVFDNATGEATKKEYKVNALNTPKKDKKFVYNADIQVMDNKLYISSIKKKIKTPWLVAGCLLSPACCIMPYYVMLSGRTREGNGFLGIVQTK